MNAVVPAGRAPATKARATTDREPIEPITKPTEKGEKGAWGVTEWLYATVPLSPAATGGWLAAVLVASFLASEFALGRHLALREAVDPMAELAQVRIAVVHCLLAAYLPTAYVSLLRAHRRTLVQLRGVLECSEVQFAVLCGAVGRFGSVARVLAGLAGVGLLVWLTRITTPAEFDPWNFGAMEPEVRWHRVLGVWLGGWAGLFLVAELIESRRLARLATRLARFDLLDLRPLKPLTRQALTGALLAAGGFGIALLILADTGSWDVVLGWWVTAMAVIGMLLVVSLFPLSRRIREEKRVELDACREGLIRERAKLRGAGEGSRIAEFLAYREIVAGISAWPIDGSTLVRTSLYLLIPLGSWAGGAIVERAIDWLLG